MKFLLHAIITALSTLLLLLPYTGNAIGSENLFIAGAEGGGGTEPSYAAFIATVIPFPGSRLGDGFVQRYWVDFQGYRYQGGARDVDAMAVGAEAAFGFQKSWKSGWAGSYVGARYTNTTLSPDDINSRVRGNQVRTKLQGEGDLELLPDFRVGGIACYVFGTSSYWARARFLALINNGIKTGPEAIAHGDPDYRAWQAGWVVTGFQPLPNSDLGIKAGAKITERLGIDGYVGIEMSYPF